MEKNPKMESVGEQATGTAGLSKGIKQGNKDRSGMTEAQKIFELAQERWQEATDYWRIIYSEMDEDEELYAGNQWDEIDKKKRAAQKRPVIQVNHLQPICRRVAEGTLGSLRLNRVRLASGKDAKDKKDSTQRAINGLLRMIETAPHTQAAIDNAVHMQTKSGLGFWRIESVYVDDEDPMNVESDIAITPIMNHRVVLFDKYSRHATFEDARYCFVQGEIHMHDFRARWPGKAEVSLEFESSDGQTTGNNNSSDEQNTIRIAEYFFKETTKRNILVDKNKNAHDVSGKTEKEIRDEFGDEYALHERETVRVRKATISGREVLEMQEWPGRYIPIVPVVGFRYPQNQVYQYAGMVRFGRDPQRLVNYAFSTIVESLAREGTGVIVAPNESIQENRHEWEKLIERSFVSYTALTDNADRALPAPSWVGPPPASQNALLVAQQARALLHDSIGVNDHYLGQPTNIRGATARADATENTKTGTETKMVRGLELAMAHSGKILLEILPYFYDTKRIIKIMSDNGELQEIEINDDGEPDIPKLTDLSARKNRYVLVQEAPIDSRREEARLYLAQVLNGASPDHMSLALDKLIELADLPLLAPLVERFRNQIPITALADSEMTDDEKKTRAAVQENQQKRAERAEEMNEATEMGRARMMNAKATKEEAEAMAQQMASSPKALLLINQAAEILAKNSGGGSGEGNL